MADRKNCMLKYAKEGIFYKLKYPTMQTGGSCDARYCYSVWMRHLVFYHEIKRELPQRVAEFGPGDTIGTGLIALLCGAEEYYALDFMRYSGMGKIDQVFKQLLEMIRQKSDIPDDTEFPNAIPKLKSYQFPTEILTDDILAKCLTKDRLDRIRKSIRQLRRGEDTPMIHYLVPWWEENVKGIHCDLIFSQAVFEHIDDYRHAHEVVGDMANSGAVISHAIDFDCHMCAEQWNGHWAYGKVMWKMVYGSRPYFLNRVSLESHIRAMQQSGFKIMKIIRTRGKGGITRGKLCRECRNITERDFMTKNAYIIGIKESN